MMFDEPCWALPPTSRGRFFTIIDNIRKSGTTILMVEQNACSALEMCDYAYLLETSSIVLSGSGKDLIDNEHVRSAYLGR